MVSDDFFTSSKGRFTVKNCRCFKDFDDQITKFLKYELEETNDEYELLCGFCSKCDTLSGYYVKYVNNISKKMFEEKIKPFIKEIKPSEHNFTKHVNFKTKSECNSCNTPFMLEDVETLLRHENNKLIMECPSCSNSIIWPII